MIGDRKLRRQKNREEKVTISSRYLTNSVMFDYPAEGVFKVSNQPHLQHYRKMTTTKMTVIRLGEPIKTSPTYSNAAEIDRIINDWQQQEKQRAKIAENVQ